MLSYNPSIPDNTSVLWQSTQTVQDYICTCLTIHPLLLTHQSHVLSHNASIHDNIHVLWQAIHSFCSTSPSIHPHHICIFWQSINSWQHLFSLRIHPYLFPDYPSIHDTTCALRIHPYLFPGYPSIPNNTCILWQSIHSWQHLFSQNSSIFVPWLPILSW